MIVAAIAAALVSLTTLLAATAQAPSPDGQPQPQVRRVGEKLLYSLHGVMSQSIRGTDASGHNVVQTPPATSIKGHENISVTALTASALKLHRSGSITAMVQGAKPITNASQGWTSIDSRGIVTKDKGKLGGLFLLPLAFLGDRAMNSGNELQVGDRWSATLGTKLYGMSARPRLQYAVLGQRRVLGVNVFTIQATGTVRMKEPVVTTSGVLLGYATGPAQMTVQCDYDRENRRLISLDVDVRDTLRYAGRTRRTSGSVRDHQRYLVALDASSMVGGLRGTLGSDPLPDATTPPPSTNQNSQPAPR